jgi:signal transduction histidine kinase
LPPATLSSTLIGFALGILLTAGVSWSLVRRHLARVRAAERRARAAERMAEIGSMTGGLAHEIKNPLSTIGLNAQLLSEGIDELKVEPEEKGRLLKRVAALRREADRLRGILTDFLQYAGNVRVEPIPADLNLIVFMPQAQQQGIRMRIDLAPGPLMTQLDAAHLKQAVLNLMLNAVQAMGPQGGSSQGGMPVASQRHDESPAPKPRELILKTNRAQGSDKRPEIHLHVIDTGPGIDAAAMEKIFQPYYTTKSGGTGLGLPTARRLVEAHHGRLELHSEPGKGSDFTIVLPAV